jgi:mannonate dehydratase
MKESFRWYGPQDPVTLQDISQTGATKVVSALHDIPNGEVWNKDAIKTHQQIIRNADLEWEVVESVPIHEEIKLRIGSFQNHIDNYKKTLENLASCGIHTICYNFMPVLDWTRTHLFYPMKDGSTGFYYNSSALAAFDLFILKREGAEKEYDTKQIQKAKNYFEVQSSKEIEILTKSIIAGLPGAEEGYTLDQFRKQLKQYEFVSTEDLRENLILFLEEIIPAAEKFKVKMSIHPDDPPFNLFGIPRVVRTSKDLDLLFKRIPSLYNGLTYCTGSLGVRKENNLKQIFDKFTDRIHFIHLRSIQREGEGNFFEANHLEGDVDMFSIVYAIIKEEQKRKKEVFTDWEIPMRPDHGHQMLDDLNKKTNPGYSVIGRLRGLSEIRGLALGISKIINK